MDSLSVEQLYRFRSSRIPLKGTVKYHRIIFGAWSRCSTCIPLMSVAFCNGSDFIRSIISSSFSSLMGVLDSPSTVLSLLTIHFSRRTTSRIWPNSSSISFSTSSLGSCEICSTFSPNCSRTWSPVNIWPLTSKDGGRVFSPFFLARF